MCGYYLRRVEILLSTALFIFFFMYNRFQIFGRYPEAKIVAAKLAALKLQAAKALPKNKVPNPFRAAHPSLLVSVWTPPPPTYRNKI